MALDKISGSGAGHSQGSVTIDRPVGSEVENSVVCSEELEKISEDW